jgi:hypothetical protein
MVQVQQWPGPRMERECLRPPPAGADPTLCYGYLGDMQLRFRFHEAGQSTAAAARPDDLPKLDLTPQQATALAVRNTLQAGGPPRISPFSASVYTLRGEHVEYTATYLLDRAFWRAQLQKFPQGLLAALPRKGVLMFAAAGEESERELAQQAGRMLAAPGNQPVSACMYRFDAQGWHPHADLPLPAPARDDAEEEDDEHDARPASVAGRTRAREFDLERAAVGQRMLVFSILGGFVVNGIERGAHPHFAVILALSLALTVYSLVGVVRLGSGLGRSTGAKISCMVLTCVPLVNLATWIVLSLQATRALRAAGWKVGLLGAKE